MFLYLFFFSRLFINNLVISLLFSLVDINLFFMTLGLSIITIGFLFSIYYNELTHKNEYYFYYNRGISKVKLIVFAEFINIVIGSLLIVIYLCLIT